MSSENEKYRIYFEQPITIDLDDDGGSIEDVEELSVQEAVIEEEENEYHILTLDDKTSTIPQGIVSKIDRI